MRSKEVEYLVLDLMATFSHYFSVNLSDFKIHSAVRGAWLHSPPLPTDGPRQLGEDNWGQHKGSNGIFLSQSFFISSHPFWRSPCTYIQFPPFFYFVFTFPWNREPSAKAEKTATPISLSGPHGSLKAKGCAGQGWARTGQEHLLFPPLSLLAPAKQFSKTHSCVSVQEGPTSIKQKTEHSQETEPSFKAQIASHSAASKPSMASHSKPLNVGSQGRNWSGLYLLHPHPLLPSPLPTAPQFPWPR